MKIVLILGTARKDRRSELVANVLKTKLTEAGHIVTMADVREYVTSPTTIPAWGTGGADEVPTKWQSVANEAEAFVHVLPEYNHGYPGEWKLLMDSLGKEYIDKTAYLVGVSGGSFGGARVVEHVQPVLWELGQKLSTNVLYVSSVKKTFNKAGELSDETTEMRFDEFVKKIN